MRPPGLDASDDPPVVDLRDRPQQARILGLLHATTAIGNEQHDLADALDQALESLCGHLDLAWAAAHVLEDGTLVRQTTWQRDPDAAPPPPTDQALLRRPVDERHVVWLDAAGRTWLGIPLRVGRAVRGVIEAGGGPIAIDRDLVDALGDVGVHVGRAVERSERSARLHEVDEAQALFVARAAHELRGPLATVGVASGVLAMRHDRLTAEQQEQLAADIEAGIDRLRRLISRLVDLADVERGALALQVARIPVGAVARSVALAVPAGDHEVAVDAADDAVALADELAVEQVLTTLLLNAVTHGGPHVRVTVRRAGGVVETTVSDDGEGVPPAILPTLFQPFARGRRGHDAGFGLGLSIARRLARACGGDLTLVGPSTFALVLPSATP